MQELDSGHYSTDSEESGVNPYGNNRMTTESPRKRLRTASFQAAKGSDVMQTEVQMVSSTLAAQKIGLNISRAAFQQSQKPVITATSIARQAHDEKNSSSEVSETEGASVSAVTVAWQQYKPATLLASDNEVLYH